MCMFTVCLNVYLLPLYVKRITIWHVVLHVIKGHNRKKNTFQLGMSQCQHSVWSNSGMLQFLWSELTVTEGKCCISEWPYTFYSFCKVCVLNTELKIWNDLVEQFIYVVRQYCSHLSSRSRISLYSDLLPLRSNMCYCSKESRVFF